MNQQSTSSQHQLSLARQLWFGSYHGVLSTHSQIMPEYPFGSLVPFCRDSEGSPVLLLSHLAQHTCNLESNPHCSLLLLEKGEGNVQQLRRLTCLAMAKRLSSVKTTISEHYFRHYPETRKYHQDLNFNFYRLKPVRFYFVGGFGQVRWLEYSRIVPDCGLTEIEKSNLLTHVDSLVQGTCQVDSITHVVGVDCLGLDLRIDRRLERLMLTDPATSPEQLLLQLESALEKKRPERNNMD